MSVLYIEVLMWQSWDGRSGLIISTRVDDSDQNPRLVRPMSRDSVPISEIYLRWSQTEGKWQKAVIQESATSVTTIGS